MDLLFLPVNKIISDSLNKIKEKESEEPAQLETTILTNVEETKQCKNKNS